MASEVSRVSPHLSFFELGILSSLCGGDRVEGNLEDGLADATGETSAKAISKISEAISGAVLGTCHLNQLSLGLGKLGGFYLTTHKQKSKAKSSAEYQPIISLAVFLLLIQSVRV